MRCRHLCGALASSLTILLANCLPAQNPPDLSQDEKAALTEITAGRVLSTLSFLASDEMAGRDTGSNELNIASAYVAARFRGAGLEGIGEDKSFYLHAIDRVLPNEAATVTPTGDGQSAVEVDLLACGDAKIDRAIDVYAAGAGMRGGDYTDDKRGAALVDAPPSRDIRGMSVGESQMFMLLRQVRQAKRSGAEVLFVKSAKDSPLRELARSRKSRFMSQLANMGLPVMLIDPDFDAANCKLRVPAWKIGKSENRNVCAVLRGRDPELSKEAILITAHLDHVGIGGRGADRIRNGADDNATGVTAVLSLADAFGALKTRPKRSVLFMTFWGEERGLVGSRDFARRPAWPLEKIVANINIEMVGRPEEGAREKMWMTGWTKSDLGDLMAPAAKRAGIELFRHKRFSAMLYRRSDNWSFVEKGVVAHSFSAGSLHSDYHQPGDEWHKIDVKHMTRVIQGLFAGSLPLAHGEVTPRSK